MYILNSEIYSNYIDEIEDVMNIFWYYEYILMIIYFLLMVNIYGYANEKLNECNHQQLCESMP